MPQPQVQGRTGGWHARVRCCVGPQPRNKRRDHISSKVALAYPHRSNGGSIGWIAKGQTVPEFESAAFGTAPGGLAVCTTRFGVHLLQVLGER